MRRCLAVVMGTLVFVMAGVSGAGSASPGASGAPSAALIDWPAPITVPDLLVFDVLPFGDGLVAMGSRQDGATVRVAAWWSADGSSWEPTLVDGRERGYAGISEVVETDDGLVAVGIAGVDRCPSGGEGSGPCRPIPVAVWRSADGRAWERVRLHRAFGTGLVRALASAPSGLLAIGADGDGLPTVWRSTDGVAWEPTRLLGEGFDRAQLMDVAVTEAGWVMVGSTGGRHVPRGGVGTPNGSVGAAWTSADGVTWTPATVDGTGEQVELRNVYVGVDGLTAVGALSGGPVAAIWTSTDGTAWTLLEPGPEGVTRPIPLASDGD